MKSCLLLALLVAGTILSTASAQTSCTTGFADSTGACVKKCVFPAVGDVKTKTCLASMSACTANYLQPDNTCVATCPTNFVATAVTGMTFKVCAPCLFKDSLGNCYDKCPMGQITDTTTNMCITSPSSCTAYFLKDQMACVSACPTNYTADATQTPKACIPCKVLGNCSSSSGTGSTTVNSSCTQYLAANMQTCGMQCPPGQLPLAKVSGQTYQQCQGCPTATPFISYDGSTCVASCGTGYVVDKGSMNCLVLAQCMDSIFTDSNNITWCVNQCPPGYTQQSVQNQTYMTCATCASGSFISVSTQQCVATCAMPDASGKYCLSNINQCFGYISTDSTKCQTSCASGQYVRKSSTLDGQFNCLTACASSESIMPMQGPGSTTINFCVPKCPPFFSANSSNICTQVASCTTVLSLDGKQCLPSCPPGQYPVTLANQKAQSCKPCMQKLSSDGKSCSASCATGELFDVGAQQCKASSACTGIVDTTKNVCLNACPLGQVQQVSSAGAKSCINKSSCTNYISSDQKSCVTACNSGEGISSFNSLNFCVVCPIGVNANNTCMTSCSTGQVFNVATKACITSASCTGILSADGNRCVPKCIYPEVKTSASTTQCQKSCPSGQLYQDGTGCIASSSCTGAVSSDGFFCVTSCAAILQIVDDSTATPPTCAQCAQGQYPSVSGSTVTCANLSTDGINGINSVVSAIKTGLNGVTAITPSMRNAVKGQLGYLVSSLESNIQAAQTNSTLSATDQQALIQTQIQSVQSAINIFLNSVSPSDAATNVANGGSADPNQLLLGTNVTQIIAEKQKPGFAFKLKFNIQDLVSGSNPSLQQSIASVAPNSLTQGISSSTTGTSSGSSSSNSNTLGTANVNSQLTQDASGQTDSTITMMTTTNQATNPYCTTSTGCPSGLLSIQTNGNSSGRLLQSSSSTTTSSFQVTYSVDSSVIQKTVCVSYDSSGNMSLATTSVNTSTNTITCTFSNNSALYQDTICQYVSTNQCSTNFTATVSSSVILKTMSVLAMIFFMLV